MSPTRTNTRQYKAGILNWTQLSKSSLLRRLGEKRPQYSTDIYWYLICLFNTICHIPPSGRSCCYISLLNIDIRRFSQQWHRKYTRANDYLFQMSKNKNNMPQQREILTVISVMCWIERFKNITIKQITRKSTIDNTTKFYAYQKQKVFKISSKSGWRL